MNSQSDQFPLCVCTCVCVCVQSSINSVCTLSEALLDHIRLQRLRREAESGSSVGDGGGV